MKLKVFVPLILILFVCNITLVAQDNMFSFNIGYGIALDEFSNTTLPDADTIKSNSGFAKNGIAYTFDFTHMISDNFGLFATLGFNTNGIDNAAMNSELSQNWGDPVTINTTTQKNWQTGSLVVGPAINFYISKGLRLLVRGGLGYCYASSPKLVYSASYVTPEQPKLEKSFLRQEGKGGNVVWHLGGGVIYNITDRIYTQVTAYWYTSKIEFDDVNFQTKIGDKIFNESTSFKTSIDVLNISGGLGIRF